MAMAPQSSDAAVSVDGTGSTWPAERTPGKLDAEEANQPLRPSFMNSFHQALLATSEGQQVTEYINNSDDIMLRFDPPDQTYLSYPLAMYSQLPELPPEDLLQSLVQVFSSSVYPKMHFVNYISINNLLRVDRPRYLTLAMACLGSIPSGRAQSLTDNLWWAANILIATTLEVDNREARKEDLVNAWVLLEIYGTLSADLSIRDRTNMTHGYVETAARRLWTSYTEEKESQVLGTRTPQQPVTENNSSSAIPAFVFVDVLRSIHFGLPPTLTPSEFLSRPATLDKDYNQIYLNLIYKSCLPPTNLGIDSAFLALVAILGDIHTLSIVFFPLEKAGQREQVGLPGYSNSLPSINAYLPFSPPNENRVVKQKLHTALDLWEESYITQVSSDTVALFFFCRMYLSMPDLALLPSIAGYLSTEKGSAVGFPSKNHEDIILESHPENGTETLKYAWRILDNVRKSSDLAPIWLPIVVFNASLVVWRMLNQKPIGSHNGFQGSLRVLQLFKSELENMKWPCCPTMASTLEGLMLA